MSAEEISTGEREPGRWETLTGSEQDLSDIRRLEAEKYGDGTEEYELNYHIRPPERGMMLRSGNEPAGYIICLVGGYPDESDEPRMLFIIDLFIKKQFRSPGTTIKLVRAIREYGEKQGATFVAFGAQDEKMHRMYRKVASLQALPGPGSDEKTHYILPLEKLDARTLARQL